MDEWVSMLLICDITDADDENIVNYFSFQLR